MREVYKTRDNRKVVSGYNRVYRNGDLESSSTSHWLMGDNDIIWYNVPGGNFCNHHTFEYEVHPWSGVLIRERTEDVEIKEEFLSYDGITSFVSDVAPLPDIPWRTNELLAHTNPTEPSVSVPNLVYELKDLPGMLRSDGLELFRRGDPTGLNWKAPANAYLVGKMGWGPLIGDTLKMAGLQQSMSKRLKRLKQSHGPRGTAGKMTFGEVSNSIVVKDDNFIYGRGDRVITSYNKRWGSVRWKATSLFPNTDAADTAIAAASSAGLTDPITDLWNSIPWTWMADWFGTVGTYVAANSNQFFVTADEVLHHMIVLDQQTDTNVKPHQDDHDLNRVQAGHGHASRRSYLRRLAPPSAPTFASKPILTEGHVTTAVALLTQRIR